MEIDFTPGLPKQLLRCLNRPAVTRLSASSYQLAENIGTIIAIHRAVHGRGQDDLPNGPVVILTTSPAYGWHRRRLASVEAYGFDHGAVNRQFIVHEREIVAPLVEASWENGIRVFETTELFEWIESHCKAGSLIILQEDDLLRGAERDGVVVHETTRVLMRMARDRRCSILVLAVDASADTRIAGHEMTFRATVQSRTVDLQLVLQRTLYGYVLRQADTRDADRLRDVHFRLSSEGVLTLAGRCGMEDEAIDFGAYADALDLLPSLIALADTKAPVTSLPLVIESRGGALDVLQRLSYLPVQFRGTDGWERLRLAFECLRQLRFIEKVKTQGATRLVSSFAVSQAGRAALRKHCDSQRVDAIDIRDVTEVDIERMRHQRYESAAANDPRDTRG